MAKRELILTDPFPRFRPPAIAVPLRDDLPDAWPREMETIAARVGVGGSFPIFFTGGDGLLGVMIECDAPVGVGEHQQMMMR